MCGSKVKSHFENFIRSLKKLNFQEIGKEPLELKKIKILFITCVFTITFVFGS